VAIAIQSRDLRKTYDGKVEAVRGLNLEIQTGECFGLLGPNGAGKTTTIEILEGLLQPTSGEVSIFGHSWRENAREMREWLGISLQETRLSEKLTVRETVELFASFYREPRSCDEVLEQLQLTEKADSWVGKLSGGQRQRLAVATALVCNPKILFLDEPTTGLDPQSRRQLWDIIREFQRAGGTVLLTTHYMDEAERLCDRVAIMDHGRIIALGTPQQLIASVGGEHIVEFALIGQETGDGLVDPGLLTAIAGVESHRVDAGVHQLSVRELHTAVPLIFATLTGQGLHLSEFRTHSATLEDVFVGLTGRNLRDE
jgi:ABC-2 type transport system ATP-binding protein